MLAVSELILGWVMPAYLVGAIPIGQMIAYRKFGIDLIKLGSKNMGATNFERALLEKGVPPKVAKKWRYVVEGLDQLKGLLPILAAVCLLKLSSLGVMLVGIGLILGHCYSFWLGFKGGKGVATTMGIVMVLCPWIAVPAYLYWFLTKKALARRTEQSTALASIRAGFVVGVAGTILFHYNLKLYGLTVSHQDVYLQGFFAFAALHIFFAHRENLRKYSFERKTNAKSRERKIGGDMPTGVFVTDTSTNDPMKVKSLFMQKKKYAPIVRLIPAKFLVDYILPNLPSSMLKMGEVIHQGKDDHGKEGKVREITWGYGRTPRWIMDHPKQAVRELVALVQKLEMIGADIVCLGANTAVVGDKGKTIERSVAIPVTNGNRLTMAMAVEASLRLLKLLEKPIETSTGTVVGSGGSVGDGVCRLLLKAGIGRLILVGSTLGKQASQVAELSKAFPNQTIMEMSIQKALKVSDLAIFASSATSRDIRHKIKPDELPPDLIVTDMERPRYVSSVLAKYDWFIPNDGAMVRIPGVGKAGIGLPPNVYFPCYSELALMLFRGWKNKWCYQAFLPEIEAVFEAAIDEGFALAAFRLNEKPLTDEQITKRITAAKKEIIRRAAS